MYPELAELLEAMCDLLHTLAEPGQPVAHDDAIARARDRMEKARAAHKRVTGMTISR
jgi:hypothetical protein